MVGLVLPNAMARPHEVPCRGVGNCAELTLVSAEFAQDCDNCPPPEHCPCAHDDHDHDHDSDAPAPTPGPSHDEQDDPSQPHEHHHHHHHCVCTAANAWVISGTGPLTLHPPRAADSASPRAHVATPDSPVFLLERPPRA